MKELAEEKSEFYDGEIFIMASASVNHNRIAINVLTNLSVQLDGSPCEAFPRNLRILVAANALYTHADAIVTCGELDFFDNRTDTIKNPVVLIEVLSQSTARYDHSDKFTFYQTIPSPRHHLLIDQYRVHVAPNLPGSLKLPGRFHPSSLIIP